MQDLKKAMTTQGIMADYPLLTKPSRKIPMASHCTFGIGGPAEYFITLSEPREIIALAQWCKKHNMPYMIIAGGSNIVPSDKGTSMFVIQIRGGDIFLEGRDLLVDAGVALADVVKHAIIHGFTGLEQLSGIPGSVGGAIVGNAGAYGHSIAEVVDKVEIWNGKKREWIGRDQCNFSYRHSLFKERPYIVLRARLHFKKGNFAELKKISDAIILERQQKYPPGIKCPGSFFKNVLLKKISPVAKKTIDKSVIRDGKIPAGYLLTQIGARDLRQGGIEVAPYHGNLLLNTGSGTEKDVKRLAKKLKEMVYENFFIHLEEEVRYI